MNEVRQVANAINEEFKKAQIESLATQDFWDRIAKAAIDKLEVTRKLNNDKSGSTSVQ